MRGKLGFVPLYQQTEEREKIKEPSARNGEGNGEDKRRKEDGREEQGEGGRCVNKGRKGKRENERREKRGRWGGAVNEGKIKRTEERQSNKHTEQERQTGRPRDEENQNRKLRRNYSYEGGEKAPPPPGLYSDTCLAVLPRVDGSRDPYERGEEGIGDERELENTPNNTGV